MNNSVNTHVSESQHLTKARANIILEA